MSQPTLTREAIATVIRRKLITWLQETLPTLYQYAYPMDPQPLDYEMADEILALLADWRCDYRCDRPKDHAGAHLFPPTDIQRRHGAGEEQEAPIPTVFPPGYHTDSTNFPEAQGGERGAP